MPGATIKDDHSSFPRGIGELKEDVAIFEAQLAALEQENLRSSILFRKLGLYFGFGAAGKLERARFKLSFKQKELNRLEAQLKMLKVSAPPDDRIPEPGHPPSAVPARETARQKMERMIAENPPPLAVHIRRVYRPLIEAEG